MLLLLAETGDAVDGTRDCGGEALVCRDVKRLTKKLKIILTSISRSQYSRSRARSSAVFTVVAGGSTPLMVPWVSKWSGSSSIPHSDASLYMCDVGRGKVGANWAEAGEEVEVWPPDGGLEDAVLGGSVVEGRVGFVKPA